MIIKLFVIGLISLCLMACTNKPLVQSQVIVIKPPVITSCKKMTITDCQPKTNGELYQCALQISKELALCAAQTEALINWQHAVDQPAQR